MSLCVKCHHFVVAYAYIIANRDGQKVESGSCFVGRSVNNFIHTTQ